MDETKIKQRIAGRAHASEVVALFDVDSLGVHGSEAFFDYLRLAFPAELAKPIPPETELQPMSDWQASDFGARLMMFGKHAGTRIDQVPLEYLIWLAESPDEFRAELRRYLKSKRVQIEQDMEPDDE